MKKLFLCLMMLTLTFGVGWADDLYILGMVNGNGSQPNQAVKMTYDDKNDIYTANIWVIGNSDNPMGVPGTWFAFTTVVANDNDNGGWGYVNDNRYSPSPDYGNYYWLTNGPVSNVPLTKQNNDKAFLIPAGLYRISVSGDLSSFNLDEVKDLTPTITPEGGDVPMGALVNVRISENFNTFISECNPVFNGYGNELTYITPPVVKFFVNDIQINYVIDYGMNLNDLGEITITGKCTLVAGNTEYITKTASETYNVYPIFNATIPATTITGGIVSFNATYPFVTTLEGLITNEPVNVYVTPMANRELATLTYTPEGGSAVDFKESYNGEYYSFNMPKANVTIDATFTYNGPTPTETTYELVTTKTENPFEVGAKYIIVNEDAKKALGGPINSGIDIVIGKDEHFTTISSDSDVAEFVLDGGKDGWTFQSENGYLKYEETEPISSISQNGTADDTWNILIDKNENAEISPTVDSKQMISMKNNYTFGIYSGKDYYVQLYKEVPAVTLAELVAPKGDCSVNNLYTVTDLICVASADGNLVCKDANGYENPDAPEGDWVDFMATYKPNGGDAVGAYTAYDQSNWIVLKPGKNVTLSTAFVGYKIKVTGKLDDKANPEMTVISAPVKGDAASYTPNTYLVAAFTGENPVDASWEEVLEHWSGTGHQDCFFVRPKPMEFVHIVFADWDGSQFTTHPITIRIPKEGGGYTYNALNFEGSIDVDKQYTSGLENGIYTIDGVAKLNLGKAGNSYTISSPTFNTQSVITAVNDLRGNSNAAEVGRYNVAGMPVDSNYRGIVIVVMSDGTARKVLQ